MTTLREAAQQALSAIEDSGHKADLVDAAYALRAALEQPEPEPVAWGLEEITEQHLGQIVKPHRTERYCVPLYTAPPQRKPLTPEQLHEIREHQRLLEQLGPVWAPMLYYFCKAIEDAHGIGDEK